jgi:hypothetical protein
VGPRTVPDGAEKKIISPLQRIELGPLGRPAHSQSLYRLVIALQISRPTQPAAKCRRPRNTDLEGADKLQGNRNQT